MPTAGRVHYLEALPPGTSSSAGRPRGSAGDLLGTIVLIHAFPLTAEMWAPQLALADLGWRVIAPQLPGFDGPPVLPAVSSMDDYAGHVIDLLDALHLDQAVIAGLSLGGYVTFALYRHAPGYFRAMVLADTRASADAPPALAARTRMLAAVGERGVAAAADEMLPKLVCDETRVKQPALTGALRAMMLRNSSETVAGAITAMMTRPDSGPTLATIRCPTLVMVGDQDVLTPPELSEQMQAGIAGAELAIIPGAGHLSNLEQPAAFNSALARFLERRV